MVCLCRKLLSLRLSLAPLRQSYRLCWSLAGRCRRRVFAAQACQVCRLTRHVRLHASLAYLLARAFARRAATGAEPSQFFFKRFPWLLGFARQSTAWLAWCAQGFLTCLAAFASACARASYATVCFLLHAQSLCCSLLPTFVCYCPRLRPAGSVPFALAQSVRLAARMMGRASARRVATW